MLVRGVEVDCRRRTASEHERHQTRSNGITWAMEMDMEMEMEMEMAREREGWNDLSVRSAGSVFRGLRMFM